MRYAAAVLALLLLAVPAAAAPNADAALQRAVVFSMDLISRYAASVREMKVAAGQDPALKAEVDGLRAGAEDTPTQAIARLKAHPKVYAFFKKNGLSEQDAVIVGIAVIDAAFAAGEQDLSGFPNVTQAQVDFIRKNKTELRFVLSGVFASE